MPTDQQYCSSIRRETSLFANWPPNAPRQIGDYGRINGALFEFFGRLDPAEIKALGKRESSSPAGFDIMINSTRSLNTHTSAEAKSKVADGKALLKIAFTSDEGVVFAAPSIKISEITSMKALGDTLHERLRQGNWEMDHSVVVQVSEAESATILLSNQAGAGIDFEVAADAPVNAQLVAKLNAGMSVIDSHGVGIKIIGEGPLTPLFKLAYLKWRILGDRKPAFREVLIPGKFDVYEVNEEYELIVS